MTSHFAQVIKHAKFTCDPQNNASFLINFSTLKGLVDKLTASDIRINQQLLNKRIPKQPMPATIVTVAPQKHLQQTLPFRPAPCTFVKIYESENVSISVFILAESYTMPIHDHPQIYGILKTISGKVRVQSYTASNDGGAVVSSLQQATLIARSSSTPSSTPTASPSSDQYRRYKHELNKEEQEQLLNSGTATANTLPMFIPVIKETPKELTFDSDSAILTPTEANFHEITAIDGPAAFFDILTPPYEKNIPIYGPRKCSYYRNIESQEDVSPAADTSINDESNLGSTASPSQSPSSSSSSIRRSILQRIPCPPHYYCDNGFYQQPDFLLED